MNVYLSATVVGLLGLIGMAALGLAHGHSPGGRSHGGHSYNGHGHSHNGHGHSGHSSHGHSNHGPHSAARGHHQASGDSGGSVLGSVLILTSPRLILSVILGFGLIGLLLSAFPLTSHLPAAMLLALAGAGGVAFNGLLVQPYWNALMNFQSRPALSLGNSGLESADAVTDFDHAGNGLVALEFEGEVRQLLATLAPAEQQRGLRVRRGDRLRIESIDEERNRCTVSSVV